VPLTLRVFKNIYHASGVVNIFLIFFEHRMPRRVTVLVGAVALGAAEGLAPIETPTLRRAHAGLWWSRTLQLRGGRPSEAVPDIGLGCARWDETLSLPAAHTRGGEVSFRTPAAASTPDVHDVETGPGALRMCALATFGVLACGAYALSRINNADVALGWVLSGFAYVNGLLALGGFMGNRADVLGVPIFALLSMPAMLIAAVSPSALAFSLAHLAHLDAKDSPACYFPGGLGTLQAGSLCVGLMTVHSTLVHLWSRSDMVADHTWAQLGLVHYRSSPRPPALTLLIGPLILIATALNIGLHFYKARRGVGVLAGALAMLSGVLGPEDSCVWSSHVGELLLALTVFQRFHSEKPQVKPAAATAAGRRGSGADILGRAASNGGEDGSDALTMRLKAAAEAAFGAHERRELAKALGVPVGSTDTAAADAGAGAGAPAGVWDRVRQAGSAATWGQWGGEMVLLGMSVLVPQLVAALPRYLLHKLRQHRLVETPTQHGSGMRTDVRIAANTLLVSPHIHQMSGSTSMREWRLDADAPPPHSATTPLGVRGNQHPTLTGAGAVVDVSSSALAHAPLLPLATSHAHAGPPTTGRWGAPSPREASGAGVGSASCAAATPLSISELTTAARAAARTCVGGYAMGDGGAGEKGKVGAQPASSAASPRARGRARRAPREAQALGAGDAAGSVPATRDAAGVVPPHEDTQRSLADPAPAPPKAAAPSAVRKGRPRQSL